MSEPMDRLASSFAGRYRIERELGQGGMATVYLAQDLRHDRQVAIKVLRPELAAVLGADRFVVEIKTTAALQHPHILPLFDSGSADGFLYYVMPYVEGETLRTKLDREKQLGVEEAVKITTEVADALDYAHRHGVIHRDIKPENILLHDGRPMVADFGIALAVSAAAGGRMTETGMSLGTPHYMSPEQATAEKEITGRSDIYSLGAVLYEMLTGNPPHVGATAQQIIMKIVTEEAQPVTSVRKTVPPNVADAVTTALERLPADRFESAKAFADALGSPAYRSAGSAATTTVTAAAAPTARVRRALPWAIAGLAALVAAASWLAHGGPPAPQPRQVELEPPDGVEFAEYRFAALSPDAGRLAFVGLRRTGGQVLWIRDLATGSADALPGTDGAQAPFWSPDGRSIGFFAHRRLMRVDSDGTGARALCDTPDIGGSWDRQGVIVFTRLNRPMTVNASGGDCRPITGASAGSFAAVPGGMPDWLRDGRHFLIERGGDIDVTDVAGTPPRLLITDARSPHFVAPDLVVFARLTSTGADVLAQRFDTRRLAVVGSPVTLARNIRTAGALPAFSVTSGALAYLRATRTDAGPLVVDARGVILDSVAVQGTWTMRVAHDHAAMALAGFGLWTYDLARHTSVAVRAGTTSGFFVFPVWSPGDSVLATGDVRADAGGVTLHRLRSGTDTTVLVSRSALLQPSDWTPDGRYLIVTVHPADAGAAVVAYDVRAASVDTLVSLGAGASASAGVVSPDGRWLAYAADETGALEVYVRPFRRQGAAVGLSPDGGGTPRWSGDGRWLFYITPDGRVVRVSVAAGPELRLGTPETLFHAPRWSMTLFADQFAGQQLTTPFDASPDGTRFYVRQSNETNTAAELLLDWQGLLNRRATTR